MADSGIRRSAPGEGSVKVIAVVGSASDSGKTKLACAILRAIPGLGAVKISPREGPPRIEWGAGTPGKDTFRFAASGAAVVARVVAARERVPEVWSRMCTAFERLPGIVVEGAGALAFPAEHYTIFVAAPESLGKRPDRDNLLADAADCIVLARREEADLPADHPIARRKGKSVPVLTMALHDVTWGDDALVSAVRAFLFSEAGPAASTGNAEVERSPVPEPKDG